MRALTLTMLAIVTLGPAHAQAPAASPPPPSTDLDRERMARQLSDEMERTISMIRARLWGQEAELIGSYLAFLDFAETCPDFAAEASRLPEFRAAYAEVLAVAVRFARNAYPVAEGQRRRMLAQFNSYDRAIACRNAPRAVRDNARDLPRMLDKAREDRRAAEGGAR